MSYVIANIILIVKTHNNIQVYIVKLNKIVEFYKAYSNYRLDIYNIITLLGF